jgi:hypothetical protein
LKAGTILAVHEFSSIAVRKQQTGSWRLLHDERQVNHSIFTKQTEINYKFIMKSTET